MYMIAPCGSRNCREDVLHAEKCNARIVLGTRRFTGHGLPENSAFGRCFGQLKSGFRHPEVAALFLARPSKDGRPRWCGLLFVGQGRGRRPSISGLPAGGSLVRETTDADFG